YNYLLENNILLGIEKYKYEIGDLVALTEGYNVKGIGQVKNLPSPVTSDSSLQEPLLSYEVDYEDWVNVSPADIIELDPKDQFEYKLRQGIRQIQQKTIKEKIITLWHKYNSIPQHPLEEKNNSVMHKIPLNQILYGPPGTGKTYNTINHAL